MNVIKITEEAFDALKTIAVGNGKSWPDAVRIADRVIVPVDDDVYEKLRALQAKSGKSFSKIIVANVKALEN